MSETDPRRSFRDYQRYMISLLDPVQADEGIPWQDTRVGGAPKDRPDSSVEYDNESRAQLVKTWNDLSSEKKKDWLKRCNAWIEQRDARDQLRVQVQGKLDEIRNALGVRLQNRRWRAIVELHEEAAGLLRKLNRQQTKLFSRCEKLAQIVLPFYQGGQGSAPTTRATTQGTSGFVENNINKHLDLERRELVEVRRLAGEYELLAKAPPTPSRRDKAAKLPEEVLPAWRVKARERSQRKAFEDETPRIASQGENWLGAWMIGGAGMSTAGVWIRVNADGCVADIVLRKDVYLDKEQWYDARLWQADILNGKTRTPNEIACHEALQDIDIPYSPDSGSYTLPEDCANIARLRAHFIDNDHRRYSMYLQYYSNGDLGQVIDNYMGDPYNPDDEPEMIPEPFIWRIFLSLANAGLAMEKGYTGTSVQPCNWKEIIHRDLKPRNVFLDDATPDFFPAYPTPKLGDFGFAFRTTSDDVLNPDMYLDQGGTPGYEAPEQNAYLDFKTMEPVDRFKMLSKTNVWGVGMIILALLMRQDNMPQPTFLGEGDEDAIDLSEVLQSHPQLGELVQRCIEFNPNDRPTFEKLIEEIKAAINSGVDQGMKDHENGNESDDVDLRVNWPDSHFWIQMEQNDLPDQHLWNKHQRSSEESASEDGESGSDGDNHGDSDDSDEGKEESDAAQDITDEEMEDEQRALDEDIANAANAAAGFSMDVDEDMEDHSSDADFDSSTEEDSEVEQG